MLKRFGISLQKDRPIDLLIYLVAAIMLIRIIFIGILGPMPQDAYYYFYSQHLALSYFDHPPAIAYLLWTFTTLFGKNVLAIKLADTTVTLLTVFFFYRLSALATDRISAIKSVLIFSSTLMVTILSLVSTPDTPLLLFWTLSLIRLYQAIFKGKKWYWLWAGVAMGLAFDSKYTAVFLPAGMFLFLILSLEHRKLLISIWPWLTCLLFVITISPVIVWNFSNDFASFRFQGTSRMQDVAAVKIHPNYFFGLLGHQAAILTPILFGSIFYGLYMATKKYIAKGNRLPDQQLFMLCFFLPLFSLFFSISLIYWVKLNWLMPAYLSGIIWLSSYINLKWLKIQIIFSLIVHLALAVEVLFYPFPIRSDDTWLGWQELAKNVKSLHRQTGVDFVFSADGYKTSAELNLYLDQFVYAQNILAEHALQFDFIGTDLKQLVGKNALFIDSEPQFRHTGKVGLIPVKLLLHFETVTELKPILIKNNGRPVRKFGVYLCKGYQPAPAKL